MKTTRIFLLAAASVLACSHAHASGVDWSSPLFDSQQMIDNSGNLLDSSFTIELGTFATGFVPTASNTSSWQSNWKMLSRADTSNGQWVPNDPFFGSYFTNSFYFNADGTVANLAGSATFTANEQAYIWVYSNNEWALVTDNSPGTTGDDIWRLPNPSDANGFPTTWYLNTADTAIVGGVNGIQSGTPYAYDPGTNFRLQTAVIPEPGTSLLVLMLGGLLQLRRHKRRSMA